MSYLTTPQLKSFDKCTISFWFRVPQASMDAAQAESDDYWSNWTPDSPDAPPMLGLVPLVVFGKEGTSRATFDSVGTSEIIANSTTITQYVEYASDSIDGNAADAGTTYTMTYWAEESSYTYHHDYYKSVSINTPKPGKPINPSYIAVDGGGNLQINFESTQIGDVVLADTITGFTDKYYTQATGTECYTFSSLPGCGDYTQTVVSDGGVCGVLEIAFSIVAFRLTTAVADNFIDMGGSPREDHPATLDFGPAPGDQGTGAISFSPPTNLAADTWHHVLVSFDGSGGSASTGVPVGGDSSLEGTVSRISATSTLYVAVDDVNYPTGGNLFPDTNKVITGSAVATAYSGQAANYVGDYPNIISIPEGPVPSYSLDAVSVPAAEVGIPSVGKYVDHIHKVEMAEFVMWTDVDALDTSVEKNRRLFITKPDKKGKQYPVNPSPVYVPISKYAVGDPTTWDWSTGPDSPAFVPPLSADDPTFRGSGNKTLGKPDIDFTVSSIPWQSGMNLGTLKGKVVKTGKIKAYFPDPSINAGGG